MRKGAATVGKTGDAGDPVLAMLESAPIDDEPVTEDDERRIAEG